MRQRKIYKRVFLLNEKSFVEFLQEKIKTIGTAACPPYHLALVVGGMSAEMNLKSVKLASTKYYDGLKTQDDFKDGNPNGQAFRDTEWEERILQMCQEMGIGGWCWVEWGVVVLGVLICFFLFLVSCFVSCFLFCLTV